MVRNGHGEVGDMVRPRTGADVKSIWRVRACVRLVL